MAKRELTPAAQAAKMIRQHLKKNGIPAKVRSSNFSMGSSINVKVTDLLPATFEAVKSYCAQYEYGHFDGMTDTYHYSNKQADIPQAKFVSVDCEYSDSLQQAAWKHLCSRLGGMEDAPNNHTDAGSYYNESARNYGDVLLWRVLRGEYGQDLGFWSTRKPHVRSN